LIQNECPGFGHILSNVLQTVGVSSLNQQVVCNAPARPNKPKGGWGCHPSRGRSTTGIHNLTSMLRPYVRMQEGRWNPLS
jgi:hypothetical protein